MESFAVEFFIWFVIVLVFFWITNSYIGLKRFASIIISFLIASIVVFIAYQGDLLSEILITATFLIFAFYGLTAALRSIRSDYSNYGTKA